MMQKLTYDEWKEKYAIPLDEDTRNALKEFHNIDADAEHEWALRQEYDFYINHSFKQ